MTTTSIGRMTVALAVLTYGCGEYTRQGTSPSQVVITMLEASSGAQPETFSNTLRSDVITAVHRTIDNQQIDLPTVLGDSGRVTMALALKDPGQPGVTNTPSGINRVTFSRYRVTYRRADGRNTPGVDVPFAFDSAATFTVPNEGVVTATFELVRQTAKEEAPLAALRTSGVVIATIADVAFFGRDLAGHEVTVVGSIGVFFGNFADPQ